MEIVRYVIRLKNGGFLSADWDNTFERQKVRSVDLPIDADMMKSKGIAEEVLNEILTGSTNILVLYDDENPPVEVVEVKIKIEFN